MVKNKKRGRKPVKDKVQGLTVYVRKSKIRAMGGAEKCRELLLNEVLRWPGNQ